MPGLDEYAASGLAEVFAAAGFAEVFAAAGFAEVFAAQTPPFEQPGRQHATPKR